MIAIGGDGEFSVLRSSACSDPFEADVQVQKSERVGKLRIAQRAGSDDHHHTRLEGSQVFIEQYDDSGRLLKVTPPGYLPLDEIV